MRSRPLDPGVVCQITVDTDRVTEVSTVKPLQTIAHIERSDIQKSTDPLGRQ
jgi:hypothetical protein